MQNVGSLAQQLYWVTESRDFKRSCMTQLRSASGALKKENFVPGY